MDFQQLKRIRCAAGLSQAAVANVAGLNHGRCTSLERGRLLPKDGEAARYEGAINQLIVSRAELRKLALEHGIPQEALAS